MGLRWDKESFTKEEIALRNIFCSYSVWLDLTIPLHKELCDSYIKKSYLTKEQLKKIGIEREQI